LRTRGSEEGKKKKKTQRFEKKMPKASERCLRKPMGMNSRLIRDLHILWRIRSKS